MIDYFALLGQPRRPWLEPDTLKSEFVTRAAATHPDRIHDGTEAERQRANGRTAELNSAYSCLREPRDRLKHLLELEIGCRPTDLQEIPQSSAELFMRIASTCREADAFIKRHAAITSPLLRAQNAAEVHKWMNRLAELHKHVSGLQEGGLAELRTLDVKWEAVDARAALLPELERICRLLGFFGRWQGQVQERMSRLLL